jgi:hypothetical protein
MSGLYAPVGGGSGDFRPIPAGTYFAVCTALYDIGLQPGSAMYPKPKHVLMLKFEIPQDQIEWGDEGAPFEGPAVIYERFTLSMNAKAVLRATVESWYGASLTDEQAAKFDVQKVVGRCATLTVVHNKANNGKVYANVATVGPLPKSMPAVAPSGELVIYHAGKRDQFDKVPEFVKEKIRGQLKPASEEDVDEQRASEFADDDPFGEAFA